MSAPGPSARPADTVPIRSPIQDSAAGRAAVDSPGAVSAIEKAPTGIAGFDEITGGGLPRGRTTLVIGGPGAGKTIFALSCLANGARLHGEPGIFVAFEENARQLTVNAAPFGWDLPALERERLLVLLDAQLSPSVVQTGEFDLGALLAVLAAQVEDTGARRVVFDGVDVLLTLLNDPAAERREIFRIHEWLQEQGLTGILTTKAAEAETPLGERYAFLQFMVDCVVELHHRLAERVALRSVRVRKYRGSGFAEGEFPLVISTRGIEVSTFGPAELDYPVFDERLTTGIDRLDAMLDGGYYRGSSVLISGAPGTAKTTLAALFVEAACRRDERALYVSFEEAGAQLARNLRSVGIDLGAHADAGRLTIRAIRTEAKSAEAHLIDIQACIRDLGPRHLVLDPLSSLASTGGHVAAMHASLRVLDLAKSLGITVVCTSLVSGDAPTEASAAEISTVADTWIHLAYLARGGERNRTLTVVKSRGTRHSNQVRELILSDDGVTLADVYTAGGEVLVGTARREREQELREFERRRRAEAALRRVQSEGELADLDARIATLERERATRRAALAVEATAEGERVGRAADALQERLRLRGADRDTAARATDDVPDDGARKPGEP
jgi:circadian clock protein KaiC